MKVNKARQAVVSLRVTTEFRQTIEAVAAIMTRKQKRRVTLTDVLEDGIRLVAKREGVKS